MGLLDSITRWFQREATDVEASVDALQQRLEQDLTRKERELAASPQERVELIQNEIDDTADSFDAIRDRIERAATHVDAETELVDSETNDGPTD
jgi:phage shock protein A